MFLLAKIFAVLSGKGGVGKSTFCANTGIALSKKGKRVLLIDGDVTLRSLDLLLGVDEMVVYDWSDIINGRGDHEKVRLFYNNRLQLLPAPLSLPESFDRDSFKSLVSAYSEMYDYIFIDCPAGVGELSLIYSACADECIIVATPDNVSARSACVMGNRLVESGFSEENIRLVINRMDEKAVKWGKLLNIDEVIDITYLRLLGVVPEDKRLMFSSVRGKSLPEHSPTAVAFCNIAERIMGKEIPLF